VLALEVVPAKAERVFRHLWHSYFSAAFLLSFSNDVLTMFDGRRMVCAATTGRTNVMLKALRHHELGGLNDRLRDAAEASPQLLAEVIDTACRRFPSLGQSAKTARIEQLIQCGAWTDAALALIDLELPLWKVRRIAYDEGEWHCALSRQRELPDWLDQSIEAHHADLALAILSAFVEARRVVAPSSQTSVPSISASADTFNEIACTDNYA
jgi:hypothetical protein